MCKGFLHLLSEARKTCRIADVKLQCCRFSTFSLNFAYNFLRLLLTAVPGQDDICPFRSKLQNRIFTQAAATARH
ncbi:Uncharacterised protein [Enterobacter cloacae]|nr:Uncharacterised protein [Enterobacter cloacae]